jgi:hypothetical protein
LDKNEVLKQVDVISSVSGGAYTTYWYFMQQYYKNDTNGSNELFFKRSEDVSNITSINESRYQHTLENSSDILSWGKQTGIMNAAKNYLTLAGQFLSHGLSIPLHLVTNQFWDWDWDWDWNIAPFHYFYQHGLERTYGYAPNDYSLDNFVNDRSLFLFPKVYAQHISLKEMGRFLNAEKKREINYPFLLLIQQLDTDNFIRVNGI